MAAEYHEKKDVKTKVDGARRVMKQESKCNFDPYEVSQNTTLQVKVDRHYLIPTEQELRGELRAPRLLRSHVPSLPTMVVPCEGVPSHQEIEYMVPDHERPFRTAIVSTIVGCQSVAVTLPDDQAYYTEQGLHAAIAVWSDSDLKTNDPSTARVTTV